jgi:large subunit ribosomal protein L7/L12
MLQSPGNRKILVINAVVTVTGMGLKEAKDLVDGAPGLVLSQVTSERADRAKNLLKSLGATVAVSREADAADWVQ